LPGAPGASIEPLSLRAGRKIDSMTKIADLIADNSQEISRLGTRHTDAVRERPEGG
jgi:hypothetical protein